MQCDIHGYYPNMSHEAAEELFRNKLLRDVANRALVVLRGQYDGEKGYNPGSQMIQILGISMLDKMDHYIKEHLHIKYYLRYMDDFILIHKNKEYLTKCKEEIDEYLNKIGFELHPKKTKIYELSKGIKVLGFTHKLTESGKVIRLINPQNVKAERRKLKKMVALAKKRKIPKRKADECYKAWKAHASAGNTFKLIERMNKYYKELWNEE